MKRRSLFRHLPHYVDRMSQERLRGWKTSIGGRCVGNSRLLLAVSMSFVGPLLKPLGEESFGIHFLGKSSIGKTGLARLATSAWGSEIRSWRTTDNSAES